MSKGDFLTDAYIVLNYTQLRHLLQTGTAPLSHWPLLVGGFLAAVIYNFTTFFSPKWQ